MASVLIVDDDPICRAIAAEALGQDGHRCEEAEDGEIALRRLEQGSVDLLITDLLMPNKEGIETILDVRRRWPQVKIIAMSGGSMSAGPDQLLQMAQRLGADETLAKPLRADPLRAAVRRVLA